MNKEDFNKMSITEIVDYITKTYHEPLRESLKKLDFLIDSANTSFIEKYPDFFGLTDMYDQFKTEILTHVTREDLITFPAILRFEQIYTNDMIHLSDDYEFMYELINETQIVNQHNQFNTYLSKLITFVEGFKLSGEDSNEMNIIRSILINLQKDNVIHSQIENEDLYSKGVELQNKLKLKLENMK